MMVSSLVLNRKDIEVSVESYAVGRGTTYWLHIREIGEIEGLSLLVTKQQLEAIREGLLQWKQ